MKRIFIVALFVLGMYNVSVFGMAHEVILTELYSIMPLDVKLGGLMQFETGEIRKFE